MERVKKSLGSFTKKNNKKYDPLNKEDASIKRKMKLILLLVKASELETNKNASEQLLQSYELNNKVPIRLDMRLLAIIQRYF